MWTLTQLVLAADLAVGPAQPYTTLEDALGDAVDGDRLVVDPGTYLEDTLDVGSRTLTIEAAPGSVLVEGRNGRRMLDVGAGGTLTVIGVDFDGADDMGLAVVGGGTLVLDRVTVVRAQSPTPGQPGGSLDLTDAIVSITDSVLDGALAPVKDGGHVLAFRSAVTLTRTTLRAGDAAAGGGVALRDASTLVAVDSVFEANVADEGAAIDAVASTVDLSGVTFVGNLATEGVIRCVGGSTCSSIGGRYEANGATAGAVMWVEASAASLAGGLLCRADAGTSVVLGSSATLDLRNTVLTSLRSSGSLISVDPTSSASLLNNTIVLDESTAPAIAASGPLVLTNNLFAHLGPAEVVSTTGGLTGGYNLYFDNVGGHLTAPLPTDLLDVDPLIGAPQLDSCLTDPLRPRVGSPLVDAGDPALVDADGSRSDIGAFGGEGNPVIDDVDADGDGFSEPSDCNDADPLVSPASPERFCNGVDDDCNPATADDVDGDADGVSACLGDCDDADPAVFPGATEVLCNGKDDDCDPSTLGSLDQDADGVGECDGDCDDLDPGVSPLAPEISCNGVDDDCDPSTVDDVDNDADGVSSCQGDCNDDNANGAFVVDVYFDGDGDGYGIGEPTPFCVPPSNSAPVDGDCDDLDPTAFPGATEVPYDGIDQDCDGVDADDLDADGVPFPDDCDDQDPVRNPDAEDLPDDGIDQDCSGDDVSASLIGGAGWNCGCASGAPPGAWLTLAAVACRLRRRR